MSSSVSVDIEERIITVRFEGFIKIEEALAIEEQYYAAQRSLGSGPYAELVLADETGHNDKFVPSNDLVQEVFTRMIEHASRNKCVAVARVVAIMGKMQLDRLNKAARSTYVNQEFDSEADAVQFLLEELEKAQGAVA